MERSKENISMIKQEKQHKSGIKPLWTEGLRIDSVIVLFWPFVDQINRINFTWLNKRADNNFNKWKTASNKTFQGLRWRLLLKWKNEMNTLCDVLYTYSYFHVYAYVLSRLSEHDCSGYTLCQGLLTVCLCAVHVCMFSESSWNDCQHFATWCWLLVKCSQDKLNCVKISVFFFVSLYLSECWQKETGLAWVAWKTFHPRGFISSSVLHPHSLGGGLDWFFGDMFASTVCLDCCIYRKF